MELNKNTKTRPTTNTEDKILLVMLDFAIFNAKRHVAIDKALENSLRMYEFLKKHIKD